MTSPMEQIADRLKTALKLCDVLTASVKEASPVIEGVRTKLENLILQHAGFTSASADAAKTEEIRSQLVAIRMDIRECSNTLAGIKSDFADRYRSLLGTEKESFEYLTDTEQKNQNAPAYEAKTSFHQVSRLLEVLDLITADLLNLSGEMEHQTLQNRPTPDIGHFEYDDNVPAPSSLSP
ncbi:hypothetical protein LJK87_43505 [Paenibacillus sp. P25]|nr:hypothetical protein LJK87_43505 [Paenibacillus sp. P25]